MPADLALLARRRSGRCELQPSRRHMGWASGFLRAPPSAVGAVHRFMVPSSGTALHALAGSGTTRRSVGGFRRYGLHGVILSMPAAWKGETTTPDLISRLQRPGHLRGLGCRPGLCDAEASGRRGNLTAIGAMGPAVPIALAPCSAFLTGRPLPDTPASISRLHRGATPAYLPAAPFWYWPDLPAQPISGSSSRVRCSSLEHGDGLSMASGLRTAGTAWGPSC